MARGNHKALNDTIGKRIAALRKQHGLSQQKLGEKLGVTFQQIQKYEKGTNAVSIGALISLCQVFKITPHQMLGWQGPDKGAAAQPTVFERVVAKHGSVATGVMEMMVDLHPAQVTAMWAFLSVPPDAAVRERHEERRARQHHLS